MGTSSDNGVRATPKWIRWVALALILLGVLLRARQYAVNRSLWLDESMLALNIVERSPFEFLKPLGYGQSAPPLFLLAETSTAAVFGSHEWALRLVPFAAGLLALPLMWIVARRWVARAGSITALALFAVADRLVYYSSEVKQYSTDVLVTLVLLLLADRCLRRESDTRRLVALGAAGAVALWLSHPSAFVLAGIGLALGADRASWLHPLRRRWMLVIALLWVTLFVMLYTISLRPSLDVYARVDAWLPFYMPMPPWRDFTWFGRVFRDLMGTFVGMPWVGLAGWLLLGGALSLALRHARRAALLVAPLAFALLASGFRVYPFAYRLLLFAFPLLFLLFGECAERVRVLAGRWQPAAGWVAWTGLTAVLLHGPLYASRAHFLHPDMGEHIRPVLQHLAEHRRPDDAIYVYYSAEPAFLYYAPRFGIGAGHLSSLRSRRAPEKYAGDLARLAGQERVWFVFSHPCRWCPVDEQALFLQNLDGIGLRIDQFEAPGAAVYLYDLRVRQQDADPTPR